MGRGRSGEWEVTFRLKSIPPDAQVFIDDGDRGKTPVETGIELGRAQRILARKEGFLPWERTLQPQRREPIELTAVLIEDSAPRDTTFNLAQDQYKKGNVQTALDLLNDLIAEKKPDAPKAMLSLVHHYLENRDVKKAQEQADALRKDFGAFEESAQADLALYQHATASLDSQKQGDRTLAWQQASIAALEDFLGRQSENRYAEEARKRVGVARQAILNDYTAVYSKVAERLEGDLEDAQFSAAADRLKAMEEKLKEALDSGFALEIPSERRAGTLRQRMLDRQQEVAEEKAFQIALRQVQANQNRDEAVAPWEEFLKNFPDGKFATQARESLARAQQAARDWHGAEYTRAMDEAARAMDDRDLRKAGQAAAAALRHRPNDAAALALQKRLVPTLVVESTPAGVSVEIKNQKSDHPVPYRGRERFVLYSPIGEEGLSERLEGGKGRRRRRVPRHGYHGRIQGG
ncbi:MAG: PEGA domain-containing protein [Planctomycetes bacterium]|nr:PEGA domain-containing protein [Planctomycetota bacterium]